MAVKQKTNIKVNQNAIYIVISIFIIAIVYFTITVIKFFQKPADTVIIKNGELINYKEVTGYVIRNEELVDTSEFDGLIKNEVEDASRIANGGAIMSFVSKSEEEIINKIEELDKKIDVAIESQQTIFTNDVKIIESEIEGKIYNALKDATYMNSIKENKKALNEKINKKARIVGELSPAGSEIKTLIAQRTEYESKLNNSEKLLISPKAGLVSYRIDNLEDILTYESISTLTTEKLKKIKANNNIQVPISNGKVKIVDNFSCYIAIPIESGEVSNTELNDVINIRFSNTGDQLIPATVEYISVEEDDNVLLVLKVKTNVEELTKYRKLDLDIVWWRAKGLKVNKDAISYTNIRPSGDTYDVSYSSIIDSGDDIEESYKTNVVTLPTVKIKRAYSTENVYVKITKKTDDFVIIENYTDAELIELGLSENEISNRATLRLYDEALILH